MRLWVLGNTVKSISYFGSDFFIRLKAHALNQLREATGPNAYNSTHISELRFHDHNSHRHPMRKLTEASPVSTPQQKEGMLPSHQITWLLTLQPSELKTEVKIILQGPDTL